MLSFFALHYAALLIFAVAAWGYGRVALRSWPFPSALEGAVVAFGVGVAILSYLVFALGLAGLLTRPWLLALVTLGVGGALLHARRVRVRLPMVLAALAAIALASPIFLQPLYPPVDGDATAYHLAAPKLYLQAHRLIVTTYLRYPVFPQLQEMLFTLALGLVDDVAAHLVSFSMWIGCALAIFAIGRRLGDRRAALLAAGIWIGSPTAMSLGSNAYIDIGLTFFVALSMLAWVCFAEDKEARWAALAGAFAGCAAAAKYSGLFFVVAIGVGVALAAPRGRRARSLALYAGLAAVTALPWYARNALLSGDPLFPFLGRWLPNPFWNADDLHRQLWDLHARSVGRSALDAVRLWDRLAFNQGLFVGPERVFSPAFWIPLPILLLALWRRSLDRALLLVAATYLAVWFSYSQEGRYLLPILPVLCVAMARVLSLVLAALRAPAAAAWALAALLALPSPWYARDRTRARGLPPVRHTEREAFLTGVYPSYPAYAWLNQGHGTRYRVYAWRDGTAAYFADGAFVGDWFGPARYARIESALPDWGAVHRELTALGVDYFLLPHALGPTRAPEESTRLKLVRAWPGARLYSVADGPEH